MKIYSITRLPKCTCPNINNSTTQNYSNKGINRINKDIYTGNSFIGYTETVSRAVRTEFTNDSTVEELFIKLINLIKTDSGITKTKDFDKLFDLYKKYGFRGILNSLWKPNPEGYAKQLIEKAQQGSLVLAKQKNTPVLELFSSGKQGFWASLFDLKGSTTDAHLIFNNNKNTKFLDFSLCKKGGIALQQSETDSSRYTEYYLTGNRHFVTENPSIGFQETTYYKEDGSKDFLQNRLHGGPAIPM